MIAKEAWGALSTLLGLAGTIPYVLSTLRGATRPQAFSWLIWGIGGLIVAGAQYVRHAGAADWVIWFDGTISLGISALAFRRGDRSASRTDWFVLAVALLALPLWYLTANPMVAVLLIATVDFLGFIPTFCGSWSAPEEEKASAYATYAVAFFAALPAVEDYNAATIFYPSFLAACNLGLVLMLLWRRRVLKAN